jgi:hypothetical protein
MKKLYVEVFAVGDRILAKLTAKSMEQEVDHKCGGDRWGMSELPQLGWLRLLFHPKVR